MGANIARRSDCMAHFLCHSARKCGLSRDSIPMVRSRLRSDPRRRPPVVRIFWPMDHGLRGNIPATIRPICSGNIFHTQAPIAGHRILRILFLRAVPASRNLHGGCQMRLSRIRNRGRSGTRRARLDVSFHARWSPGARYPDRQCFPNARLDRNGSNSLVVYVALLAKGLISEDDRPSTRTTMHKSRITIHEPPTTSHQSPLWR